MRTMKNNWLLAAAVSAALSGYAGVSMAADAPAFLELTTAMDTVSNKDGAPSTKVKLWVIDATGNITSNDMTHTVNLTSSNTAVIGSSAPLTFPAGASYIEAEISKTGAMAIADVGSTQLSAAFAETGSTGVTTSMMLPITVVADFMKASNTMTSPAVAGTEVSAFNVTDSNNAALAGKVVTVVHYDIGSSYPPAEVIGGTAGGLGFTPDSAGLDGAKGSFPTVDADGNLKLVFEVASANPTTTGEYYILKDPMGQFADVRVDNLGSDNQADVIPAAASDVIYIDDNAMVLDTFNVAASGTGFSGPLPALTTVDAYGNIIASTDLSDANVTVGSSSAGGTLANGVISYDSLESDNLVLSFAEPAGASLNLTAVAAGTQPVMSGDNCLSITMAGTAGSISASAVPAGAKFTGGISTAMTTVAQRDIRIDADDAVNVNLSITADAAATGSYGMVVLYVPPVPNAPTYGLTVSADASGNGIGGAEIWDFNTATIPAYNTVAVPTTNDIKFLENFEFGFELTGTWFIAPGYNVGDAYVTCVSSINVQ